MIAVASGWMMFGAGWNSETNATILSATRPARSSGGWPA